MAFSFPAISAQLRDPGDGVFRDIEWLEDSRRVPDVFMNELMQYHATLESVLLKSDARHGYDFYHDLVLRHALTDRIALCWIDDEQRLQRLSYAELHAQCTEQRAEWMRQGVEIGQTLCVLSHLGPELLTPLFCGLRMGLTVSLLPPAGPDFLARRLRALAPDFVAAAPRYLPLLRDPDFKFRVLTSASSQASPLNATQGDATSHAYGPQAIALRLFPPAHDADQYPIELSAANAYQAALRDGLLLLGLLPGQIVAVSQQDLLQTQPALLFTTMLRGATLLHLAARDFQRDSRRDDPLGKLPPIHILLVNNALRAVMQAASPRPLFAALKLWIRSPQEDLNPNLWQDFIRLWGLQATPAMALLLDAGCGGGVLFSRRRAGGPPLYVMPVPGRPCEILALDDSGDARRTPHGILQPAPSAAGLLLTRLDGGYLYAGTQPPTREGRLQPRNELEAAVRALPFVRGASRVEEPEAGGGSTLLIFAGPETPAYARRLLERRENILKQTIAARLGADSLPSRIVVTSQLPRVRQDGQLDHAWCAQLLQSGDLRRRAANPVFALLDRLLLALLPAFHRSRS